MMRKIMCQKIFAGWKGTAEMSSKHTQFYLDKQNAKWKGVCAGIADYTGVDVLWVRLGAVMLTLMGGFPWTLIAYWGAAWFANKKPIHLYLDNDDQKFWQGVAHASLLQGLGKCKTWWRERAKALARRLRRTAPLRSPWPARA